jgi:hypothetical protein
MRARRSDDITGSAVVWEFSMLVLQSVLGVGAIAGVWLIAKDCWER